MLLHSSLCFLLLPWAALPEVSCHFSKCCNFSPEIVIASSQELMGFEDSQEACVGAERLSSTSLKELVFVLVWTVVLLCVWVLDLQNCHTGYILC